MTFEQLQKANEQIKTTDIGKGKEYAEVNQRVKAFRMLYPNGSIQTELVSLENGMCIFRAMVFTEEGNIIGTGTAYEKEGSSFINKTSFIENCETSAIGRALAFCGIGIDTSIASYEEVANAKLNQGDNMQPLPKLPETKAEKPKKVEKIYLNEDPKDAYPDKDKMLALANEKYPKGSKELEKLLACWNIQSIEEATPAQLMVIWNKYGN